MSPHLLLYGAHDASNCNESISKGGNVILLLGMEQQFQRKIFQTNVMQPSL